MPKRTRTSRARKPKGTRSAMVRSGRKNALRLVGENKLKCKQTWHANYASGSAPLTFDIYKLAGGGGWVNTNIQGSFTLNKLSNSTNFVSLFDQYRIKRVTLKFEPSFNVGDTQTAAAVAGGLGLVPTLCIATDLDGTAGAPASEAVVLAYPNAKKLYMDGPKTYSFVPRASELIYSNAMAGVGFSVPKPGIWIDSTSPDAPHYGIVWFMDTSATGPNNAGLQSNWTCKVYVTYDLEFQHII